MRVTRRHDPRAVTDLARQLGALMKELDLAEIEVSTGHLKVRLQRPGAVPTAVPVPMAPVATTASGPVVDVVTSTTLVTIEAPMVGTFYRASSPTAEPYVREGDVVKQGQILCIIEAMKLMNEIESKAGGRIEKILVENGQPVEYGQPLFLIEPAG
jgi:acetyl-CoA carboxylase biotin carboxyl carrier protein